MNPRRLYRCRENRQIAGVAAGMAEYLEIDPTVIRIAWILSAFLGGFTILLYIILAFVIPLEPIALGASAAAPGSAPEAATASGSPNEIPAESPAWAHAASAEGSAAHAHERRPAENRAGQFGLVLGVLFVVFGAIALVGPMFPGWSAGHALGPAFVLALGIALLAGAVRRPATGE